MSYHQTIYNRLRQHGLSEAGAIGMLGNWQAESNCEPNRVQGDFSPYRTASKAYVSQVTSGAISRQTFGHDGKGFGLYQLTYFSRKLGYYDYWKQSGKALDDAELQTDYAVIELKQDYPGLYQFLCSTTDVYSATSRICREFERPAHNNIDARFQSAQSIKHELDLNATGEGEITEVVVMKPGWEKIPATEYWPPRMICSGMNGDDVMVLQAILKARGYAVTEVDGAFGSYLEQIVRDFQDGHALDVDGIVGPMTWTALLNRG